MPQQLIDVRGEVPAEQETRPPVHFGWIRLLDLAALLAAVWAISVVVPRHEPWLDEAQSWLMARDLGLKELVFHYLRYEGNPGLWHLILWLAIHVFHAPYAALGYIAAAFGAAGIAFLIFFAPFPRLIRYLCALSYFILYQYAVIARPYVLLPIVTFLAAHLYRKGLKHLYALTVCWIVLSAITAQGVLIAGGMMAGMAWTVYKGWKSLDARIKRKIWISAGVYALFLVLLAVILWPPKDLIVAGLMTKPNTNHDVSRLTKLAYGVTAILPFPGTLLYIPSSVLTLLQVSEWVNGTLALDLFVLAALGIVCYYRKTLLPYVVTMGSLFAFYAFIYGSPHHEGIQTVALISALWIAAPSPGESKLPSRFTNWYLVVLFLFATSFAVQVEWSFRAMRHDYSGTYCGAMDAAKYLQSVGAENQVIYAYDPVTMHQAIPGWIAIQPYFSHNIIANYGAKNAPPFDRHSTLTSQTKGIELDVIERDKPDYVVISMTIPPDRAFLTGLDKRMSAVGYEVAHTSPGEMFFKNYKIQDAAVVIFRRKA